MKTVPHDWTVLKEQELPTVEKIRRGKRNPRYVKNPPEKKRRK